MNFLSKLKHRRALAPGLTLAGIAMILSKLVLKWLAPIALTFFGVYRVVAKKKFVEGSVTAAVGILLWLMLSWRFVDILLSLMMIVGFLFLAGGVFLFIANKKERSQF